MKPTLRRNGKHMVSLRITHHLDRDDVLAILCDIADYDVIYETAPTWGKAETERQVRAHLTYNGLQGLPFWTDNYNEDEIETVRKWADDHLTRIGWPANL